MSKVKSIKISDFRVYEGTVDFNFHNSSTNSLANLVAIYAPNGFGKTSFFDAIEWTYSDKIRRFENNILKKEVKEDDFSIKDRIVLTNRNSYKRNSNTLGKVTIDTESGQLVKEVAMRKRSGVSIKDDYRAGKITGDFDSKKLTDLSLTNILTYDQIDGFLKLETPEKKFESLQDFWPEGKKALEKYRKVMTVLNKTNSKNDDIESKISEITYKISRLSPDQNKLDILDKNILEINDNELLENKFDFSDRKLGKDQYESLIFTISLNKKVLSDSIKIEENKVNDLFWLDENHAYYCERKNIITNLSLDIELLKSKRVLFSELSKLKENEFTIQQILKGYYENYENYKYLSENYKIVNNLQDQISNLNLEIKDCYNKLDSTNKRLGINHSRLNKIIRARSTYLSILENTSVDQTSIDSTFLKLKNTKSKRDSLLEKVSTISKTKGDEGNTIGYLESDIIKLESVVKDKEWSSEYLHKFLVDANLQTETLDLLSIIGDKDKELNQEQELFATIGVLQDNLSRIMVWGEQYINHTHQNNCPLCDSSFGDFDELLKSIEHNKNKDSISLDKSIYIENLKKDLRELKLKKEDNESKIVNELTIIVSQKRSQLIKCKENYALLINSEFNANKELANLEDSINSISQFFVKHGLEISELNDVVISLLQIEISKKIEKYESKIEKANSILKAIESNISFYSESKVSYNNLIRGNENHRAMIKSDPTYDRFMPLIGVYQVNIEDEKSILDKKSELETIIDVETKKLNEFEALISRNASEILEFDDDLSESSLIDVYKNKHSEKQKLENEISAFLTKFAKHFPEKEPVEIDLAKSYLLSGDNLAQLKELMYKMDVLETHVELATNQLERDSLVESLQNETQSLIPIAKLKDRLTSLKNSCMKYMQEGVDIYFNKEVINQIYSRIEPHPSLTEINFVADIGDKGPRLLISAKGKYDEVNPAIYLSAGQVNVLSLSIFLAKAFENGTDSIGTIFMDDPVHNLSDINVLSFIDLLRSLTSVHNKQVVLSTHDEKFFKLLQSKLPEDYSSSKYLELASEGKLKEDTMRTVQQ